MRKIFLLGLLAVSLAACKKDNISDSNNELEISYKILTDIGDPDNNDFDIYPNPFKQTFVCRLPLNEVVTIQISDGKGKMTSITFSDGWRNYAFDFRNQDPGNFLFEARVDNEVFRKYIIKTD